MALKTNFTDDILAESMNGKRQYNVTENSNGTKSLEDVTDYQSVGSTFSAKDMNETNAAVNQVYDDMGDEFNPEVDYAVGDYAIRNNKVWKFTTAHPAGAWDESHVKATKILSEARELTEKLHNKDNPILLLDTTEVTTSFKNFDLAQSYKNFKKLYFEVEMNYSTKSNINFFSSEMYVATLQPNRTYCIYRQVSAESKEYEGACFFEILENDTTKVSIKKKAVGYDGCRRINIFGIK